MENQKNALIYIEMYLYKARKIIIGKDSTLADLETAECYLNICRGLALQNEYRIDLWYGKLELRRSKLTSSSAGSELNLENAKNAFFMSLMKSPNPGAHFGLYKIAIAEENWESARGHLNEYEKSGRKKHYNFGLAHKILALCIGEQTHESSSKTDYIFSERITYEPLLMNYQLAEDAFDHGRYNSCLKHLTICRKLALLKSITIDFTPLINMMINIIKLKNHRRIDELKISIEQSSNYGEKIVLIRKLISLTPQEKELYFLLMDSYIGLGVVACIPNIVKDLSRLELSEIDVARIKAYEKLSREYSGYADHFEDIFLNLQNGDTSADEGNITSAFEIYLTGFKNSGQSIFLFKIANLFYRNAYYDKAEQYFLEYLKSGYENKRQAYITLYKIYKHLNLESKCQSLVSESFQDLFLASRGYTLRSWVEYLEDAYTKELGNNETDYKVKELESLQVSES